MLTFTGNAGDFLKIGLKAAERGQLDLIKQILVEKPSWLSKVGSHGRTMLWAACHKGRLEVAAYLIQQGADIQACGAHYTPHFVELSCLAIAMHKGHVEVVELLKKHGAFLNIHHAAFLGKLALVRTYLEKAPLQLNLGHPQHIMAPKHLEDVDFIAAPTPWATPLCYALRGGDLPTIQFLIQAGAAVKEHSQALFTAADEAPALVQLLLEHGADPAWAPKPLPDDQDLYQVVQAFKVAAPSPEELGAELVYLCRGDRGGKPAEVERLLRHGALVNFQDAKGKTALHRAAKAGLTATVELLLSKGAQLDIQDQQGETPIFEPIRSTIKDHQKQRKVLQLLIAAGANPDHQNQKGDTVRDLLTRSKGKSKESLKAILPRY